MNVFNAVWSIRVPSLTQISLASSKRCTTSRFDAHLRGAERTPSPLLRSSVVHVVGTSGFGQIVLDTVSSPLV